VTARGVGSGGGRGARGGGGGAGGDGVRPTRSDIDPGNGLVDRSPEMPRPGHLRLELKQGLFNARVQAATLDPITVARLPDSAQNFIASEDAVSHGHHDNAWTANGPGNRRTNVPTGQKHVVAGVSQVGPVPPPYKVADGAYLPAFAVVCLCWLPLNPMSGTFDFMTSVSGAWVDEVPTSDPPASEGLPSEPRYCQTSCTGRHVGRRVVCSPVSMGQMPDALDWPEPRIAADARLSSIWRPHQHFNGCPGRSYRYTTWRNPDEA